MTPLQDRVIVKVERQREFTSDAGLYVTDDDAPDVIGTVIACGRVTEVQPEDVVIFPPSAGQRLEHEGTDYLVLREDELLAVVE